MVSPGVLAVCHANVCRSPLMEFLLGPSLRAGLGDEIGVRSAGTRAVERAICSEVHRRLMPLGGAAFAAAHRTRLLTPEQILEADLILTASAEERAHVARLDPSARTRTFTLLEAVELVRLQPLPEELDRIADAGPGAERIRVLANVLHRRRGLAMPSVRRRRRGVDGFDIRDAHTERGVRHSDIIRETELAAGDLAHGVRSLVAVSTG
ncbi:hypothetical protein [Plantibacter sp. T3]|uniref:arsenate reductase/protein-tyrosine-phosphatase family protein n=1 Tax=Plantibacter sp. T3 TaxID=2653161 RepID=UPI001F2CE523|nr:hypothetical protein [Plantibacter sp. T3]